MKSVRHFGIVTNDIEKSLHFYRDLLGLKIKREMQEEGKFISKILGLENVRVRTVKMAAKNGDALIELLEYESHQGKKRENYKIFDLGVSHVAFTVDNIDEEYERLKKEEVVFISAPQVSPDGKAKVAFCWDPNEVPVELVEEL
ncbi:MAG: VOC family protein [Candidatus Staskawiczbacteria bacterium]|nr:VOC family protein [Candidatus Staskawiczbacteria bacterium]